MSSLNLDDILGVVELPMYLERVERGLATTIRTDNPFLKAPVDRLLKTGSKRLRPSLVIAVAASQGKKVDAKVIDSAVAIELLHIASLIHDDIIDNAATRWGTPTINKQEGLDHAILVGDYVFAKAMERAAAVSQQVASVAATAFAEMCDGQSRELADVNNPKRSVDSYLKTVQAKTAALMSAACEIGGLSARLSDSQTTALARFGEAFGMAYQLIDDLLDLLSTAEQSGKPVGNDVKEGVYTMPILLSLKGPSREKLLSHLQSGKDLQFNGVDLLFQDGSIAKTIREVQNYNQQAQKALGKPKADQPVGLVNLPAAYLRWALSHQAAQTHRSKLEPLLA